MSNVDQGKSIALRELNGVQEMLAAEALQKAVWESESDYDNKDILIAIQHAGGLVAGAFKDNKHLVGFILSLPTREPAVLYSHRLAVLPEYRNQKLGEKLKWFQRTWSLARGINLIQWTFDPLRSLNANLNIRRLGGTSRTYYEDYYGVMDGINAGIPSDRILVDWQLDTQHVENLSRRLKQVEEISNIACANPLAEGETGLEDLEIRQQYIRINLPNDISQILSTNRDFALNWRLHIRRLLKHYFSIDYRITNFTYQNGPAYILEQHHHNR